MFVYKAKDGSVTQVFPVGGASEEVVREAHKYTTYLVDGEEVAHANNPLIKITSDDLPDAKLFNAWEIDENDKVIVNVEKAKTVLHECEEVHATQAEIDACKTEQDLLKLI